MTAQRCGASAASPRKRLKGRWRRGRQGRRRGAARAWTLEKANRVENREIEPKYGEYSVTTAAMLALHARRKARSRISVTVAVPVVAVLGGPSSRGSKADIGSTLWCLAVAVLSNQLSVLFASHALPSPSLFSLHRVALRRRSHPPPPPPAAPSCPRIPSRPGVWHTPFSLSFSSRPRVKSAQLSSRAVPFTAGKFPHTTSPYLYPPLP
jgi:hypothetical protein